jgi:hypothetical protein
VVLLVAELQGVDIAHMKMLQRMRMLEEKGQAFAATAVSQLKVFGGDGDFFHTNQSSVTLKDVIIDGLLFPRERCAHFRWGVGCALV